MGKLGVLLIRNREQRRDNGQSSCLVEAGKLEEALDFGNFFIRVSLFFDTGGAFKSLDNWKIGAVAVVRRTVIKDSRGLCAAKFTFKSVDQARLSDACLGTE